MSKVMCIDDSNTTSLTLDAIYNVLEEHDEHFSLEMDDWGLAGRIKYSKARFKVYDKEVSVVEQDKFKIENKRLSALNATMVSHNTALAATNASLTKSVTEYKNKIAELEKEIIDIGIVYDDPNRRYVQARPEALEIHNLRQQAQGVINIVTNVTKNIKGRSYSEARLMSYAHSLMEQAEVIKDQSR